VSYAKQDADRMDDVAGPGNGFVDVNDTSGHLLRRFASNGPLNAPWGLALAPGRFGAFSHDLLVGSFGDGQISAYDARTGHFDGQLRNGDGKPIQIDGLWALRFGNKITGGAHRLLFTAGIADEDHGLFGTIATRWPARPAAVAGTAAGPPEADESRPGCLVAAAPTRRGRRGHASDRPPFTTQPPPDQRRTARRPALRRRTLRRSDRASVTFGRYGTLTVRRPDLKPRFRRRATKGIDLMRTSMFKLAAAVAALTAAMCLPGVAGARRGHHQSCHGHRATIVGTSHADVLVGTRHRDVIVAGGGADRINARGGSDIVCAGAGADSVRGGPGRDWMSGGSGNDIEHGDTGDDIEHGNAGEDHLIGEAGDDRLEGGRGDDHLEGGAGDDDEHGDEGDDRCEGNAGNDHVDGGPGRDHEDQGDGENGVDDHNGDHGDGQPGDDQGDDHNGDQRDDASGDA
jgi:Ca2+-binding RTX toxin-like protein